MFDGSTEIFEKICRPATIEIIATVGDKIIIEEQSQPRHKNFISLVSGRQEKGESALATAKRELLEETGYKADDWKCLGAFSIDGNRGFGKAHIYLARDLHKVAEPDPDDLEDAQIQIVPLDIMKQRLLSGEVATLGVAAAIAMSLLSNSE